MDRGLDARHKVEEAMCEFILLIEWYNLGLMSLQLKPSCASALKSDARNVSTNQLFFVFLEGAHILSPGHQLSSKRVA